MRLEQVNSCSVIYPHRKLQHLQKLRAAERPTRAEHRVVKILDAYPGVFPENIERIEKLLKVREADFPGPLLRLNSHAKCSSSSTMTAAGIEEPEFEPLRKGFSHRPKVCQCKSMSFATGML